MITFTLRGVDKTFEPMTAETRLSALKAVFYNVFKGIYYVRMDSRFIGTAEKHFICSRRLVSEGPVNRF